MQNTMLAQFFNLEKLSKFTGYKEFILEAAIKMKSASWNYWMSQYPNNELIICISKWNTKTTIYEKKIKIKSNFSNLQTKKPG